MAEGGRQDSLAALADSINETGRMARANVSLTLIGALYLALTLLTAKDENLLRNAVVALPQLEAGISLKLSYLFGPVVFLYLHAQTLFLLAVLARKVRARLREIPGAPVRRGRVGMPGLAVRSQPGPGASGLRDVRGRRKSPDVDRDCRGSAPAPLPD